LLAKHDIAARSIRRLNHSFFKHGVKWWCGLTARTFCPCKTKSAKITFSKFNFLSLKNLREQMFFLFYGTAVNIVNNFYGIFENRP
jgi:hypothetical protein